MAKVRATVGSVVFLAVAPGVVAGLLPWLITGWHGGPVMAWLQAIGWVLIGVGAAVLLQAFGQFALQGLGTPAPVAPPEKLVIRGLYRYVRNPMYLAVSSVIIGQAAVLGSWPLIGYSVVVGAAFSAFVHFYEEPTLRRQFGRDYESYLQSVPRWLPRPPAPS
jgi:protein-S-isoprenylcysteine O-methyltransferase Ste14